MNKKYLLLILVPCLLSGIGCATGSKHEISNPIYELHCDDMAGVGSTAGDEPYKLEFTNSRKETVNMFWLNYEAEEVLKGSISPGESWAVNTYTTHPWVARDKSGSCIAVYNSKSDVSINIR